MQNDKKNFNSRSRRVPSVEETTAAIEAEQKREEEAESSPKATSLKSATFESLNQSSSSVNMERSQDPSNDRSEDQGNQAAHSSQNEAFVPFVPPNCEETDDHAQKILDRQSSARSRIENSKSFPDH
jgi:hypothetical protein